MSPKLRIPLDEKLGLLPPVLGYLASAPKITDGFRFYGLRHPGGIFNLHLGDFSSSLRDLVAHTTSDALSDTPIEDNRELIQTLIATLFSFTSYYNAAYDIILGCCKHEADKPTKEVWKWLKDHGYTAEREYKSNLSESKFFLDIFNELKHSSKRFGTVTLERMSDRARVTGYYLESVDEAGAIIPDPKYHVSTRGERFANSFNYDIRRLYYLLYKVADVLLCTIQHHFQEVYADKLHRDAAYSQDSTSLDDLFKSVSRLPLDFLPNEARKAVPVPRVVKRGVDKYLIFESHKIPDRRDAIAAYQVSALLPRPDGFSKSWGLPYMRPS